MTIKTKEITVGLAQLMLDPNNYRLNKGEEDQKYSDDEVVDVQDEIQQKLVSENTVSYTHLTLPTTPYV